MKGSCTRYRCIILLVIVLGVVGVVIYTNCYQISAVSTDIEEEIMSRLSSDDELCGERVNILCSKMNRQYAVFYWLIDNDVDGIAVFKKGLNGKYRFQNLKYQGYELSDETKGVLRSSIVSFGKTEGSVIFGRYFDNFENISVTDRTGQIWLGLSEPYVVEIVLGRVIKDSELLFYNCLTETPVEHESLAHAKWVKTYS